ncbi:MAG: hypothetical protein OHK0023_02060 [Anaerolineae bacterium]
MTLPLKMLYFGSDASTPDVIPLRAGALSLSFSAGDLRHIYINGVEVVQRIYFALRDENWNTIPLNITEVDLERTERSFRLSFEAHHPHKLIQMRWRATIIGSEDSSITYHVVAEALSTFRRNRIGLCLLHPSRLCAGLSAITESPDGISEASVFPVLIAPQVPFKNLQAITYPILPNIRLETRFKGDIFETEDQRNWSDGSFKTYSTPSHLPLPVEVAKGTTIEQSLEVRAHHEDAPLLIANHTPESMITVTVDFAAPQSMPRLGLQLATPKHVPKSDILQRIKALNLSHLRVDVPLHQADHLAALEGAAETAKMLGVPLEIALYAPHDPAAALRQFAEDLPRIAPPVVAWLIYHSVQLVTPEAHLIAARRVLGDYEPRAQFAAGSRAQFTELNQSRLAYPEADSLVYGLNPQVHDTHTETLIDNLAAQADTVATARAFANGKSIYLSPVTLKPRFNAAALDLAQPEVPEGDPRQFGLFGAAWTVGSLGQLLPSGLTSLTYYETHGRRGVMDAGDGSAPHADWVNAVYPMYHVFADVGSCAGGVAYRTQSSNPLDIAAAAVGCGSRRVIVIANLREAPRMVSLRVAGICRVRVLDSARALGAMHMPQAFLNDVDEVHGIGDVLMLIVPPYGIARVEVE